MNPGIILQLSNHRCPVAFALLVSTHNSDAITSVDTQSLLILRGTFSEGLCAGRPIGTRGPEINRGPCIKVHFQPGRKTWEKMA